MKKSLSCLISATLALALAACAKPSQPPEAPPEEKTPPPEVAATPEPPPTPAEPAPPPTPTRDIIDTAEGSDSFKTFAKLAEEAGLTTALREDGPLTVLVPDDAAFEKLAEGELDRIRKDKKSLAALLNYHVLTGRAIKSVELGTMPTAATAAGPEITIEAVEGTITINGSVKVVKADIMTTNGVIHLVDSVISPPSGKKKPKKAK